MRITRRGLVVSGALTVAAALAVTGVQLVSEGSSTTPTAASNGVVSSFDNADLESAFVPVSQYPEGTILEKVSIKEALETGMLHPPADVSIRPAACGQLLEATVGDLSKFDGWVQRGQKPNMRVVDAYVGTVEGGADLDRLRDVVKNCDNAQIEVKSAGLVGTLHLREFDGPKLDGAETLGVEQSVSFRDNSPEAQMIAALGSSSQVYVTSGDLVIASCEDEVVIAMENATQMFQSVGITS